MLDTNIIKIQKEDKEYPEVLRKIKNPPKELYAMGNIELLHKKEIVGIVGSRDCSEYGRKYAYLFSNVLAKENITVISGMAIGIDAAAHLGSIEEIRKNNSCTWWWIKEYLSKRK